MIQTLNQLRDRFLAAVKDAGFSAVPSIDDTDMDGEPALLIEGGIYASKVNSGRSSVWQVDVETVYPGVRYYPDGSGEPPSSDYATKYHGDSGTAALAMVFRLYADSRIGSVLEHLGEEEMADADAEYEAWRAAQSNTDA